MAPASDDLTPLRRTLGDLLAALRAAAGLTQRQVGHAVGYARVTVATAESGHRQPAAEFWTRCDDVLGAGGELTRAYQQLSDAQARRKRDLAEREQAARSRLARAPGTGTAATTACTVQPHPAGADASRVLFSAAGPVVLEPSVPKRVSSLAGEAGLSGAGGLDEPFRVATVDLAGGRFFDGSAMRTVSCAAVDDGPLLAVLPDGLDESLWRGVTRSLLVCMAADGSRSSGPAYGLDGRVVRRWVRRAAPGAARIPVPRAYELDDLTLGMVWAVANLDESLLGDDALLSAYRDHLAEYEVMDRSAAALEEADGLSTVSRMWLGSDFCARHIGRHSTDLVDAPVFWTREQSGEAASAWLLFGHKYDYLRRQADLFGDEGQLRRVFCIPAAAVAGSPRWERVLLLLAIALMESFGVRTEICTDSEYAAVEGFVLDEGRRAIVANWVGADGVWQVDVTSRPGVLREYADISGHAGARSVTAAETAVGRVRAFADYLDLDWAWLTGRCAGLGKYGTAGLVEPRSRLLSTDGLDRACRYVGGLADPDRLYAAAVS